MTERDVKELKGHDILDLRRFANDTRHMVEMKFLTGDSPVGARGDEARYFLTDADYAKALAAVKRREIKIRRHADVIEGHILYTKPTKHRR